MGKLEKSKENKRTTTVIRRLGVCSMKLKGKKPNVDEMLRKGGKRQKEIRNFPFQKQKKVRLKTKTTWKSF